MIRILYSLGVKAYYLLMLFASIFNAKAKEWIKGRKNIFSKLEQAHLLDSSNIWFHVSSLGEFEQARPLIEKIKNRYPRYKIVLSFFSPSGFEIRKNYKYADSIIYLPIDSRRNAKRLLNLIKPEFAFFVKYDFWFFFLKELKNRNIRTYLVSAIFREDQLFFKSIGKWYAKMLESFSFIFVQNNKSAELLKSINIHNVSVAGDTRFDRVIEIAEHSKDIDLIKSFVGDKFTLIAGSSWFEDEQIICRYLNNSADMKFIIAPHEIDENHIINLLQIINRPVVRYSRAEGIDLADYQVMIIDNIGMLSSIYKYGHVAYIGGGFGAGIHNIIEAAVYGMPVVFGKKYKNFQEAVDMIDLKVAYSINDFNEFETVLNLLISDRNYLDLLSQKAKDYVMKNKGASETILKFVFDTE